MRTRRSLAIVLICSSLVAAPAIGAPRSRVPSRAQVVHPLRAMHGNEARIVDDLGRTVILRGVNVNGLGEYYQAWPDLPSTLPLTENDFAAMATYGFNVVRLIVSWSRLEPRPGAIDRAYVERVAQTVRWARAHDIYVLLDMHQDAWGPHVFTPDDVACPPPSEPANGWDGAPLWATALAGTAATCRLPFGREFSAAVQASFENFYLDVGGVQSHLVWTWAELAERFAAEPAIAGYDFLNEPNPGFTIGASDYALLGLYYRRTIAAIRATESAAPGGFGHIGFFEPAVITGPSPVPGPPPGFTADRNLVYAPHLYNESISPLPFTIEQGFEAASTAASNYGTTFFSGEWGWFGDPDVDQPKIERYAAAEDAYMVGGTWWQWKQACGDPHANTVRGRRPSCDGKSAMSDGLLTRPRKNTMVLDRAYPRASPGRLTSIKADVASGSLTITGVADRAKVPADLWAPARCGRPAVTGINLGKAKARSVDRGWRIAVPVKRAGAYRIVVSCRTRPPR